VAVAAFLALLAFVAADIAGSYWLAKKLGLVRWLEAEQRLGMGTGDIACPKRDTPGMRWCSARRVTVGSIATVVLIGAAGACNDSSAPKGAASLPRTVAVSGCPTTLVHYTPRAGTEPSLRGLPWVAATPTSSRIIGHLFYYAVPGVSWSKQHAAGLRIYPGGMVPTSVGADTKILWIDYRKRSRGPMIIHGQRLDVPGRFRQAFATLGPSVINVPSSGCWHLTLHTRRTTAAVTVLATGH
jgi:hypothetical protein